MSLIRNSDAVRNLTVVVPKESTFKIPEGCYTAKINRASKRERQNAIGSIPYVRLLFGVNVPGLERYNCLAKADFTLSLESGSDLRNVINRLLGRQYLSDLSGQEFNLASLEGLACDIEVEHVDLEGRENYDYPLVVVTNIQKPGFYSLTGYEAAT